MRLNNKYAGWPTLLGLGLLVLVGGFLRLYDLDARSITHPEMWVPNIVMPEGISEPRQRLTLWKVLTGTFSSDTHPPGFYVLMWGWTKVFGTSIWSIRMPSALLGTACIPLLFHLARLIGQTKAGWIAAALLAVNGYHIFFSKVARMYPLACFLGLLATVLLVRIAKETPAQPRPASLAVYAVVMLLGLTTHIFIWAVFATHLLWVVLTAWNKKQPFPCVLRLQITVLILASPLLAFAAYQSGSPLAVLSRNVLLFVSEYVQFSFLFPVEGITVGLLPWFHACSPTQSPLFWLGRGPLLAFCVFLLVLGFRSSGQSHATSLPHGHPLPIAFWAAAGFGSLVVVTFVLMAKTFVVQPNRTLALTQILILLPPALASLGILFEKNWKRIENRAPAWTKKEFFADSQSLAKMLAVVPLAILCLISMARPLLNNRGLLCFTPYILLLLACGVGSLLRKRWVAVLLFLLLGMLHTSSVLAYRAMRTEADFRTFAALVVPHTEKTDLIFLQPQWYGAPILYYMTADRYRLIGRSFPEACRQNPDARVWTLFFYKQEMPSDMAEALAGYTAIRRIEITDARATLYVRQTR